MLQGIGSQDTQDLVALQGGQLLALTGVSPTLEEGMIMIHEVLKDGSALHAFIEMCVQQGTSRTVAEQLAIHPEQILPKARNVTTLFAPQSGYVQSINAMVLAQVARELGAGRFEMSDHINHGIGYVLQTTRNQFIEKEKPWISIHHDLELSSEHLGRIKDCMVMGHEKSAEFHRLIRIIT